MLAGGNLADRLTVDAGGVLDSPVRAAQRQLLFDVTDDVRVQLATVAPSRLAIPISKHAVARPRHHCACSLQPAAIEFLTADPKAKLYLRLAGLPAGNPATDAYNRPISILLFLFVQRWVMAEEKLHNVTRADIVDYLRTKQERLDLDRQSRDKAKLEKDFEKKLRAWVEAKGGDARSVERSGFVLAIKTKAGTVKWAEEFLRLAGEEEAKRLRDAAPPVEFLSVEPKL